MPSNDVIELLGEWEGYHVELVQRFPANEQNPKSEIWIELTRNTDCPFICSGCGKTFERHHDWDERWIRDLPILDAETHLCIKRFRVDCQKCGRVVEALPWLTKHARETRRLAESVGRLCKVTSIKNVAEFYGLTWDTVKRIDMAYLEETLGEPDLFGVRLLAMDEFAIKRGHRYATIFVEPLKKQVLWVCRGRKREDIRPFFERLGEDGCRRIEAVAMDMSSAFEAEVSARCPNAKIVFDQFHVLAKYGREVIDRVRVDEAKRLQDDKPKRKVIKGSRWLLLRNEGNLKLHERVKLRELLAANRKLSTVYILKDDLKRLWDYQLLPWASQFWKGWYSRAIRSRIEPLKKFAKQLKEKIAGVLSHCRYPLHTSLLEGINNKIKVIKRIAYGFRDDEYFFLKIRAAFPGNPG